MLSTILLTTGFGLTPQSAPDIRVFLDAKEIVFEDQRPIERAGRIYVPIKSVFQKMGAIITFDEAAKMVRITYGEKLIEVPIGIDHSYQDGSVTLNGGRAIIVNGRAMAPLRFLSEQLDAKVTWVGATRSVQIATQRVLDPPSSGTTGGG